MRSKQHNFISTSTSTIPTIFCIVGGIIVITSSILNHFSWLETMIRCWFVLPACYLGGLVITRLYQIGKIHLHSSDKDKLSSDVPKIDMEDSIEELEPVSFEQIVYKK